MEELIIRAKQDDSEAIEQLVSDYKGLIRYYANKFYLVGGNKDDLLQEGMLGLYYAVKYYDENKGPFPSFVRLCVLSQILDAVKRDNGANQKVLSECVGLDAVSTVTDGNDPLDRLLTIESAQNMLSVMDEQLTDLERRVVLLFASGYTYNDIARQVDKSRKAVDGALQRARRKLAEYNTK